MSQRVSANLPGNRPANTGRDDQRLRQRVINRDELGNTPVIIGREAAAQLCNDTFGVPISFTRMRRGFERRELKVWKVGGVNATSPQALFDWIQGMALPVAGATE